MSKNGNNNNGVGFLSLLCLLLIGLKLTGFIAWSWWLVLLPIYIVIALLIFILLLSLLSYKFFDIIEKIKVNNDSKR